jgi:single-strand selective monofunctional uracil DNA glycosylase
MNPGPFGMVQTGIPFGEVNAVKRWIGIETPIQKPASEHPRRPILGFSCPRSEVSGRRVWQLFEQRFVTAEAFFSEHFVLNYCPLAFVENSGRNRTPDKLLPNEKTQLLEACDEHLSEAIHLLKPQWAIGIGGFAAARLMETCAAGIRCGQILHPSPANPTANRDWAGAATRQLQALGVW